MQPIDRFVVEEYLLDVLFFLNGWSVNTNPLLTTYEDLLIFTFLYRACLTSSAYI